MNRIIETSVVIDFLRGNNPKIEKNIKDLISQGIDLMITQITSCELWYGVYALKSKQKQITEAKKLNNFIINLTEIKTLNSSSSRIFGEICAELDKSGIRVPQFDLLNASIAIANEILLITKDNRHFPRIVAFSEFDFLELWE
jgi:tRNA(fMet)-specific endonuclease VapC